MKMASVVGILVPGKIRGRISCLTQSLGSCMCQGGVSWMPQRGAHSSKGLHNYQELQNQELFGGKLAMGSRQSFATSE